MTSSWSRSHILTAITAATAVASPSEWLLEHKKHGLGVSPKWQGLPLLGRPEIETRSKWSERTFNNGKRDILFFPLYICATAFWVDYLLMTWWPDEAWELADYWLLLWAPAEALVAAVAPPHPGGSAWEWSCWLPTRHRSRSRGRRRCQCPPGRPPGGHGATGRRRPPWSASLAGHPFALRTFLSSLLGLTQLHLGLSIRRLKSGERKTEGSGKKEATLGALSIHRGLMITAARLPDSDIVIATFLRHLISTRFQLDFPLFILFI